MAPGTRSEGSRRPNGRSRASAARRRSRRTWAAHQLPAVEGGSQGVVDRDQRGLGVEDQFLVEREPSLGYPDHPVGEQEAPPGHPVHPAATVLRFRVRLWALFEQAPVSQLREVAPDGRRDLRVLLEVLLGVYLPLPWVLPEEPDPDQQGSGHRLVELPRTPGRHLPAARADDAGDVEVELNPLCRIPPLGVWRVLSCLEQIAFSGSVGRHTGSFARQGDEVDDRPMPHLGRPFRWSRQRVR